MKRLLLAMPLVALVSAGCLDTDVSHACALEPYLRVYTAEMQPRYILQFLMLDEDFPRSMRFCTSQMESHLRAISRRAAMSAWFASTVLYRPRTWRTVLARLAAACS